MPGASAACALLLLGTGGAAAQGYYRGHGPGYVVAESEYGKGAVTGAIRAGRHGPQVQLPGGTWIDCVRSCSETLRRATVDFWETHGTQSKGGDNSPGYFRWGWSFGRW